MTDLGLSFASWDSFEGFSFSFFFFFFLFLESRIRDILKRFQGVMGRTHTLSGITIISTFILISRFNLFASGCHYMVLCSCMAS